MILTWYPIGCEVAVEVMYCQSKLEFSLGPIDIMVGTYEKLRMPKPSLLRLPPNRFVSIAALLPVAFWDARQGIETEFSQGMI